MKLLLYLCIVIAFAISMPVLAQVPVSSTGNLLAVGNYNVNQGSSDLGAVVQLEANGNIIIDEEDSVRYFFNQSDNNLAGVDDWMLPGYDASDWETGFNAVGYNCVQITTVPDTNDQGAIYSRFELFNIPNAASTTSMTIRIDYDDGVVVWLNGEEILRSQFTAAEGVPAWGWGQLTDDKESSNKLGPDPSRWSQPMSNIFTGADNPSGSIIDYTFDVVPGRIAVEPTGKLATSWARVKAHH